MMIFVFSILISYAHTKLFDFPLLLQRHVFLFTLFVVDVQIRYVYVLLISCHYEFLLHFIFMPCGIMVFLCFVNVVRFSFLDMENAQVPPQPMTEIPETHLYYTKILLPLNLFYK